MTSHPESQGLEPSPAPPTIESIEPLSTLGRGRFGKVILARVRPSSSAISSSPLTPISSIRSSDGSTAGRLLDFSNNNRRASGSNADNDLVAVKLVTKAALKTPRRVQRTQTELKVMTEVAASCPFLVKCQGAYQSDHLLVYVMEFSNGGDIRSHLRKAGRFAESTVVIMSMQVVLGLEHLHSFGVVYRDLKPENILIGTNGQVQLADFGLSKFLPRRRPALWSRVIFPVTSKAQWGTTRTACGTPMYQPPEMIRRKPHGLEADWWSLGILIFELITGRPPFYSEDVDTIYSLILENQPAYPAYVSQEAVQIISGLLQTNKRKRLGILKIKQEKFFTTRGVPWDREDELSIHNSATNRNDLNLLKSGALQPSRNGAMVGSDFLPEYVASGSPSMTVPGFKVIPNDTLVHLVTTENPALSHGSDSPVSRGNKDPRQAGSSVHLVVQ